MNNRSTPGGAREIKVLLARRPLFVANGATGAENFRPQRSTSAAPPPIVGMRADRMKFHIITVPTSQGHRRSDLIGANKLASPASSGRWCLYLVAGAGAEGPAASTGSATARTQVRVKHQLNRG